MEDGKIFLRVAILSYNRPAELERALKSLLPIPDGVEVVVYDDKSPRSAEISSVKTRASLLEPRVRFVHRAYNLGYDRNLLEAISDESAKYVVLLSDDDMLEDSTLSNIVDGLKKHSPTVAFVRYVENLKRIVGGERESSPKRIRRDMADTAYFPPSELNNGSVVFFAILFSGLVFKTNEVNLKRATLDQFIGSIYIQVAIFLLLFKEHGALFLKGPGVIVGGDGENGFGKNDAGANDADLVNRSSTTSNIKFQKRLVGVVNSLTPTLGHSFNKSFFGTFNLRSLSGLRHARLVSRRDCRAYWTGFRGVTKNLRIGHLLCFILIYLLPRRLVKFSGELADAHLLRIFK